MNVEWPSLIELLEYIFVHADRQVRASICKIVGSSKSKTENSSCTKVER